MNNFVAKCVLPDATIRRVTVAEPTVQSLKAQVRGLFDPQASDVDVKYHDAEGDLITVVSDAELVEYLATCQQANKAPRFHVTSVAAPAPKQAEPAVPEQQAQQAQPEPQPEPEPEPRVDPLTRLAQALSNPATVQTVQAQLGSSPVIADAVVSIANAFLESGMPGVAAAASEALPAVRAVAVEAAEQHPELRDAMNAMAEAAEEEGEEGFSPMFMGPMFRFAHMMHPHGPHQRPHCGPWGRRGWGHHGHHGHHHGPHGPHGHRGGPWAWHQAQHQQEQQDEQQPQQQPQQEGVHAFVVCDACESVPDLRRASKLAGKISVRGWIVGNRYKSRSIMDFDLCEPCFRSGKYTESHGPFEVIAPRASAPPASFGGGPPRPWGGPHPGMMAGPGGAPWCRPGGPRGCRGGGRARHQHFMDQVAETVARCADAVANATDEDSEIAQIARAIRESMQPPSGNAPAAPASEAKQPAADAKAAAHPADVTVQPEGSKSAPVPLRPQDVVVEPPGVTRVPSAPPAAASAASAPSGQSPASSRTDSDEWVLEETDPITKWRDQLQRLHALGFTESEKYVDLLEEENGDLERVVNRIVRRNA